MKTLIYGGPIITMEESLESPEALIIHNGIIEYVGDIEEAVSRAGAHARRIDLHGKCLIPAFIDAHSHISMVAQYSSFANLSNCTNFQEIVEQLREYIKNTDVHEQGIIIGCSYDHNFLAEQKHPDRYLLDQVSDEIPIFIFHTSNHMGVANSALLALSGITKDTIDPQGGRIKRDPNGEPDGLIEETPALMLVMKDVFERVKEDFTEQMNQAQQKYLSYGITTVQDGASTLTTIKKLSEYAEIGLLQLDVVSYVMSEEYDKTIQMYGTYRHKYHNHLKIEGAKIVLDGSPQGKTAWLSQSYEGEKEYRGFPTHEDVEVKSAALHAIKGEYQLLAHCNGDAAADQYIRCYQDAYEEVVMPPSDLRPVMIHCQTVRDDQLVDMKKIGMIPSMFVAHTYYWGDVHLKNLGPVRGAHISPAKAALDLGLMYNFHQDSPVLEPDMLKTVWCAVNRITRNGVSIGSDQCISVYDALKGVTINAAYAYHEENRKGSIRQGKIADLIILDQNPLNVPVTSIDKIQVLETWKAGKCVYQRDEK